MKETIIFEDATIKVVSTGRDYDFVGYIKNKSEEDIIIEFDDDIEDIEIEADDWIGLLANDEGYWALEEIKVGRYRYNTIKS